MRYPVRIFNLLSGLILYFFVFFLSLVSPLKIQAATGRAMTPTELESEMEIFFGNNEYNKKADAYVYWLYGGDQGIGQHFHNDPYVIWRNTPRWTQYCGVFQRMSAKGKVGVNIMDAGKHDEAKLNSHFRTLSDCGVTIVRAFVTEGGTDGIQRMLNASNGTNITFIFAVANPVLSQKMIGPQTPLSWYDGGYNSPIPPDTESYTSFARSVAAAVQGSPSKIYTIELANEPHCGGDPDLLAPYTGWVNASVSVLRGGGAQSVSIGQMASQEGEICDNPDREFRTTNQNAGLTHASGHYYTASERTQVLKALNVATSMGKRFYVGEAGFGSGADLEKSPVFVYPGIDDQAGLSQRYDMLSRYTLTCGTFQTVNGTIINEDLANRPDQQFSWDNYYDPPGAAGISIPCPGQVGRDDNQCVLQPILANVYFDDREATIPLFRLETAQVPSPTNASRRMEDLEGFFSAAFTGPQGTTTQAQEALTAADRQQRTLSNGVARKLDPKVTWCKNTVQFLRSIKQLCELPRYSPLPINNTQLSTPEPGLACALDHDIPTTGLSYLDVANALPDDFNCSDPNQGLSGNLEKAFWAVEPTIHDAFKPAYIVRYLDTPGPFDTENRVGPFANYLNWFPPGISNATDGVDPTKRLQILNDRITLTKVYVPAGFAENISPRNTSGDSSLDFPTFRSGFMQSMQALFTKREQKTIEDFKEQDIRTIRQRVTSDTFNAPNPSDKHYVDCRECLSSDQDAIGDNALLALKSMMVRRINAELYNPSPTMNQHCSAISGDRARMVGEQGEEITQTINPPGTYDPVTKTTEVKVGAGIRWKAPRRDNAEAHIKTFFLLPEEYRNIQNYEQLLLERYMPSRSNERYFPATVAERRGAVRKYSLEGKRFLMLSGVTSQLEEDINSNSGGPVVGRELSRQTVETAPRAGQPAVRTEVEGAGAEKRLEGELALADSNANVNPQVPGGKLERTLVEILCNITRPITLGADGKLRPTAVDVNRPKLQSVLTKGLSACTDGAMPISPPGNPGGNLTCSGQTQVPSDWTAFYAIFQRVANRVGIPVNMLYGVFRLEGTPTYQAVYDGKSSLACSANSVGAVGPMGILVQACGGRFNNWERYAAQAGVTGSPCDLEASITVGATILKTLYQNPIQQNCSPNYPGLSAEQKRWVDAAASYNGSCTPLGSGFGCEYDGKNLTYGECAVVKFAPTYGRAGG